jgi:hypothetical protein
MLPDARKHAGAVRAHRRRDALEERRGAQGLAGRDQRARRAHPLELGSERRDLAGAERDLFEPCEGELEVRRVDTDGFGSSRIEGRGHGSLSVYPEDQVRSWGRPLDNDRRPGYVRHFSDRLDSTVTLSVIRQTR